ncbi:hypothetical protein SLEP1_g11623 [Rubroshorea leprosula]|nr:hypothetical protein SLEP1_g11623 [Rubroshorea leprosula]
MLVNNAIYLLGCVLDVANKVTTFLNALNRIQKMLR